MAGMLPLPPAVVFGFDGTLIDTPVPGRRSGSIGSAAEPCYPDAARWCLPLRQPVQLLGLERRLGRAVLLACSWPERYRPQVISWLDRHRVPVDVILMRAAGDRRSEALAGRETMLSLQASYDVVHAYEARADVARVYERLGVPVTWTLRATGCTLPAAA